MYTRVNVCSFVPCSPLRHVCDVLYYVFIGRVSSYSIFPYTVVTFPRYLYIICSFVYVLHIRGEQHCGLSCFVLFSRTFMMDVKRCYVC